MTIVRLTNILAAITVLQMMVTIGLAATAGFSGTPAVGAATAYALFQTIFIALVALSWGRLSSARVATAEQTI